jgi:hypothetical protein
MLRCHGTWLSFLIQLIAVLLLLNPPPKGGVGRILLWHEAVTELYLEFTQLFKAFAPSFSCPPVETNTIECSNVLSSHGIWLSFLKFPESSALIRNPTPELEVVRIILCHETVAELRLEFV